MPCIAGHYCPLGTGLEAVPCPVTTYLDTTGAAESADCKPCEKGYICNETGRLYLKYVLLCKQKIHKNSGKCQSFKSNQTKIKK